MTRLMVTGGRTYGVLDPQKPLEHPKKRAERRRLREVLDSLLADRSPIIREVIHGAMSGADILARDWAIGVGIKETPFPAKWTTYGNAAGPIRNQAMVDTKPDLVVAFPGGTGTADAVRRARKAGIEVLEVK